LGLALDTRYVRPDDRDYRRRLPALVERRELDVDATHVRDAAERVHLSVVTGQRHEPVLDRQCPGIRKSRRSSMSAYSTTSCFATSASLILSSACNLPLRSLRHGFTTGHGMPASCFVSALAALTFRREIPTAAATSPADVPAACSPQTRLRVSGDGTPAARRANGHSRNTVSAHATHASRAATSDDAGIGLRCGVSDTSLSIGARPSSANTRSHAVACCFCSDARYSYSAVSASPTGHQSAWSPFGRSVKQFVRYLLRAASPSSPRRSQVSHAPCATTALRDGRTPAPSIGARALSARSSRPPSQSGGLGRAVCGLSPPPPRKIRGHTRGVLLGVPGVAAFAPRGRRARATPRVCHQERVHVRQTSQAPNARPRSVAGASRRIDGETYSFAPACRLRPLHRPLNGLC